MFTLSSFCFCFLFFLGAETECGVASDMQGSKFTTRAHRERQNSFFLFVFSPSLSFPGSVRAFLGLPTVCRNTEIEFRIVFPRSFVVWRHALRLGICG